MTRRITSASLIGALTLMSLLGCPRTTPTPQSQAPADTPPGEAPFDPAKAVEGAEPSPPTFPPAATTDDQTVRFDPASAPPGPLSAGRREAEAELTVLTISAEGGEPKTMLEKFAVHCTLESRPSDRGWEILTTIRTPHPKEEKGFLYLTTSTGGGGQIPAVVRDQVFAEQRADGLWHYGAGGPGAVLGLINLKDLTPILTSTITGEVPGDVIVDQFEGALAEDGGLVVTGAGNINELTRVILTAKALTSTVVPGEFTTPEGVEGGGEGAPPSPP